MEIKKIAGRPRKISMGTVMLLADAIAHNTSISDSCAFVGISRSSFYHYLKSNRVFAERIANAKAEQRKIPKNFWTVF